MKHIARLTTLCGLGLTLGLQPLDLLAATAPLAPGAEPLLIARGGGSRGGGGGSKAGSGSRGASRSGGSSGARTGFSSFGGGNGGGSRGGSGSRAQSGNQLRQNTSQNRQSNIDQRSGNRQANVDSGAPIAILPLVIARTVAPTALISVKPI